MRKIKIGVLLLICLVSSGLAYGSSLSALLQIRHQKPTIIERNTETTMEFRVPSIDPRDVQEAYLYYRLDGNIAFQQKKANLYSSTFRVPLTVEDRQATELEYYFELQLHNGETVTYPQNINSRNPISVDILGKKKTLRERRVEQTGVDYTILSPDPDATVAQNDVVVAITLFYDTSEVDTSATSFQMLLDGNDVTNEATASNYFYSYSPDNISPGDHEVTFNIVREDTSLTVTSWSFSVLNPNARVSDSGVQNSGSGWMPSGQLELSARNQEVGGVANDALSGNVRLSGQKGNVSYSAYGLLTSQEDPRLQPQNRFGANLYIGDWLELEAGHVYPNMSSLTIAGQRMQGLNAGLHVWDSALNFRFVYGKLRRGIDQLYDNIEPDYQITRQDTATLSYLLNPQNGGRGTYERDIIGGRIGAGRGETFEFGLNFLKVQDDTNSIGVVNDFSSLMNRKPDLVEKLSQQQKQELTENPGMLSVNGNPRPKGNFVAASDLLVRLDNDRIQLRADGAFSLLNEDITGGVLSQETMDDLGITLDQGTEDLLQQLSWLFIVNENMNTLPFRFKETASGTSADPFFPTSLVATQSELGLNYFDNNLKLRYRWVGPGFNSLANSTIRKDVAGISVSDRIQLFKNRIYLTLGYEDLNDNVGNTKDATTQTNTYRTNLSWYPLDRNLPRVSVGFLNRNRDNSVDLFNPYISGGDASVAVQNFEIQDGDTLVAATPRRAISYQLNSSISQRFSLFGITHNANLSYSYITTEDEVFAYGGSQSSSFSVELTNQFKNSPLQTSLGFNVNNTETGNGLSQIQILGARVGGSMFLLDDKLNIDATLAFTKNESESVTLNINRNNTPRESGDDFYEPASGKSTMTNSHSYIFRTSSRYNFNDRHSFQLTFRYSNIRSTISAEPLPNDHLLQARYIFNF